MDCEMKGDVCINFEGSEEDCPKPAPGFKFDARGVLVADGSTPRSDSQRTRISGYYVRGLTQKKAK